VRSNDYAASPGRVELQVRMLLGEVLDLDIDLRGIHKLDKIISQGF
jgi:hypothetical protein